MAVRTAILNLDDEHIRACAPRGRLDVSPDKLWKLRVGHRPIDGPAFDADTFEGSRITMEFLGQIANMQILFEIQQGNLAGGSAVAVPINFVFADVKADPVLYKFDAKYGLRFPTFEEVEEEMARRHLPPNP